MYVSGETFALSSIDYYVNENVAYNENNSGYYDNNIDYKANCNDE